MLKWAIDDWVKEMAGSLEEPFSPLLVAEETGLDLSTVVQRCLELCGDGKLKLVWEMHCPKCSRSWREAGVNDIPDVSCQCGEELSAHDIYLLFAVTPEYRGFIKKCKPKYLFSFCREF